MTGLPDPLVPPETDVRDLDGFMLNVERLLASELWALSTGEELKAALALWCRAWKQLPGGSLPDDERVLAAFSGTGARWKKVRAMALRGFVKCSDGRLYHAVLCADVLRAAQKKAERRERTRAATEARKRGGGGQRNDDRDVDRYVQRNDERDVAEKADVTRSQGQGQGRKEEILEDPSQTETLETSLNGAARTRAPPTLWDIGAEMLGSRPLLGKLLKRHGDDAVADAITRTMRQQPAEPKAYCLGLLKAGGATNGRRGNGRYETPHDRVRRLNGGETHADPGSAGADAGEGHGATVDQDGNLLRR